MRIAVTGATGFIGRYIVQHLVELGHTCRCWYRPTSDRIGLEAIAAQLEWIEGELGDAPASAAPLVEGCDAVVHSALFHPGGSFMGGEGDDLLLFVEKNVLGTLKLIEAARAARVDRFIFLSTCAVHDKILEDRPLDETHPAWPASHYGAHKAALEKFVHSYGWGSGYPICALRPTGVYGVAQPMQRSKWFDLAQAVRRGEPVECLRGGKEVHAADVARAVGLLLTAPNIAGEAFNCYDRYVSQWDIAQMAKRITGSASEIRGTQTRPKNQIDTRKLRALGMTFGGDALLERTVAEMCADPSFA